MAKNTVIVSVLGDTRDLQGKLGGAGSAFSKFAAGALLAAGVVATAIGVKAVKSASNLEQAMGGLGAVFKTNGAQMEKWAEGAAGSLGLAKSEYASLATVLGAQMKNMGIAQEQLGDKTHNLIGLGADLAAQFGGSTSDAVSALSSLLRGERNPIERYGVSMNEAAVKAKMAEMGLSGLTGEAEKNAKLQATLAILYDQTADAQGAFARESTTLAGAQQRLAAGTENLYAKLGTALLPAVTAITAAAGSMINKLQESAWFEALTSNLVNASNVFADFVFGILNGTGSLDFGAMFAGIMPAVITGIQSAASWIANGGTLTIVDALSDGRSAMLGGALQLFQAIATALPQILPQLMVSLLIMVQDVINLLVSSAPQILATASLMFTSLVQSLALIVPQLVTGLMNMLPLLLESLLAMVPALLDGALQLFTALVESIPLIVPPLIAAVVALLPQLVSSVISMIPGLIDGAVQLFTALVESLPIILPVLLRAVIDLLPALISAIISMIPRLIEGAVQLFTGLVTAIPKILPELIPAIIGLVPVMVKTLIDLLPKLVRAGVDLIGGLIKGIVQSAGAVGKALIDIAKNAISGFLSFLGIKSPSRLFMGFGANLGQGLAIGIGRSGDVVSNALDGMASLVNDGFAAALTTPEIDMAFNGPTASARGGNTYQITVQTLNPTAEAGRIIIESIRDYESFGGRA